MSKYIICGIDLHDETMLTKTAVGRQGPRTRTFRTGPRSRERLIEYLLAEAERSGASEIVVGYEASSQGYGLYDDLTERGMACHVLAPTRLAHTAKSRRQKTDEKDAERILEALRGHVLAGNELPEVWVPDPQTRDDRETVRARLDVGEEKGRVKNRIRTLLKRYDVCKPKEIERAWSAEYETWLASLTEAPSPLGAGARVRLASLLRQLKCFQEEVAILDEPVAELAQTPRYRNAAVALLAIKGVGMVTAMAFLTEIGDPTRFGNRRQLAAYLGVVPSSDETGQDADRKGHITHQGPPRVRKVLCQAAWARVRSHDGELIWFARVACAGDPKKRRKLAIVGVMRRLGILMWHRAVDALAPAALHARAGAERAPEGRCQQALPADGAPSPCQKRRPRAV